MRLESPCSPPLRDREALVLDMPHAATLLEEVLAALLLAIQDSAYAMLVEDIARRSRCEVADEDARASRRMLPYLIKVVVEAPSGSDSSGLEVEPCEDCERSVSLRQFTEVSWRGEALTLLALCVEIEDGLSSRGAAVHFVRSFYLAAVATQRVARGVELDALVGAPALTGAFGAPA